MRVPLALAAGALLLLLSQPAAAQIAQPAAPAIVQHQRLLPLEGGRNFRDLGGYRARDGRTVKWGLLFRSGSMHGLTAGDYAYLERRGIRVVCDFRDSRERAAEPAAWPASGAPAILTDDYALAQAGMMPPRAMRSASPEEARRMMASLYPRMLTFLNGQYRRMFAELLAGHAPLAFNCSAGKDRTGVAAALLLTALGVPRATVIEDYLLTNRYLDARRLLAPGRTAAAEAWTRLPAPVQRALMAADRSYIEAALAVLDRHPGGPEGYFRDALGLSRADLAKLRDMYLE